MAGSESPALSPTAPRPAATQRVWALVLSVILLSSLLQTAAALQKSFWEDETYTAIIAVRTPSERDAAVSIDVHPPLYLNLAAGWGRVFGYNEIGLRSLSIVFAALAIGFTFFLAQDLVGTRAALFAVVLLGFNPLWLMFGHNARYYSLSAALAVLCALSTLRFTRTGRVSWLLIYVAVTVLYLYLVYTAVIIFGVCSLLGLYFIRIQKEMPVDRGSENPIPTRYPWQRLSLWLGAQGVIFLAYLPGLSGIIKLAGRYPQAADLGSQVMELLKRTVYSGYVYTLGETISPLHPAAWLGALISVLFLLIALRAHRRTPGLWAAGIFAMAILGFNLALSMNAAVSATWQALPARNMSLLPFLAICLGAGIATMRPPVAAVLTAVLLAVYALAGVNYFTGKSHLRPIFAVPWRQVFERISDISGPNAVVLCSRGDEACSYYQERFGYPRRSAGDWPSVGSASEIWWIQSNLDRSETNPADLETLAAIQAAYQESTNFRYAIQDPSIQMLKERWLGGSSVSERLTVYRFIDPLEEK